MAALLPNRTHTVPATNLTYAYISHPPTRPHLPTILLLHGFPSTSHDWHHQITHLQTHGYGILAPDCLGYGQTSKPLNTNLYTGKSMASDLISILDHEGIRQVVGVAHDWGTYLLSALVTWFPERVGKAVFFSVPFTPPGRGLDVHRINERTKRERGFEQYGYQVFLASEGAGRIIGEHWESFFHLLYPSTPTAWTRSLAPLNALHTSLLSDLTPPLASYITPTDKAHHHSSFGSDYSGPCQWYVRGISNLGVEDEKLALKKGRIGGVLKVPTLMVGGLRDEVCPAVWARKSMEGFVVGGTKGGLLRVVDVDAGHWIMLEKAEETNKILLDFIEGRDGAVKASL